MKNFRANTRGARGPRAASWERIFHGWHAGRRDFRGVPARADTQFRGPEWPLSDENDNWFFVSRQKLARQQKVQAMSEPSIS